MTAKRYVMGLFQNEDQAAEAVNELKATAFQLQKVHSPIPSHKLSHALDIKKSRVGYFTLVGGILGLFTGFGLASYTAIEWNLIVSGKPIVALIPFFIVGFEFTILFAVFGNVIGMLALTGLPQLKLPDTYDPRCSSTHFGIVASCALSEEEQLTDFFQQKGGEVKVFK
jgi:molybdopterin-containing oxidoreductase family membrane subunit